MIFLQVDNDQDRETTLFVVLEKPNVERMAGADPVTISAMKFDGFIKPIKYPDAMQLIVCYEQDTAQLHAMASMGGTAELVRYLLRGYKFDEAAGDGNTAKPLTLQPHANRGMQA
jgi:hypothetical protein